MGNLNTLESAVLEKLLLGNLESLQILRNQMSKIVSVTRECTGFGFFTSFQIEPTAPRLAMQKLTPWGDVGAIIPGMECDVGFLLWIDNGLMIELEGYTYGDEPWPTKFEQFQVVYFSGEHRDLAEVRNKLS